MAAANPPIFEVRRGTKVYGGIRAINEVDITLRAGEISRAGRRERRRQVHLGESHRRSDHA